MPVSRRQLEASLERVRARTRDPREGVYGPSSMVWRVNREQLLFAAGARAVLLEAAHPYLAHAIDQHSVTKQDPVGRFVRTFQHVHAMIFGDLERAMTSARRVYKYHSRVRGPIEEDVGTYSRGAPYSANDERALFWVHATFVESSILAYELIFRPLSSEDKERYYQETKLFAYMFGIPDAIIPPTWPDFVAYNERMWGSSELAVGGPARDLAAFILTPTNRFAARFAWLLPSVTAGMLPARFREEYGLAFGVRERALYRASLLALRAGYRALPPERRFVPAYLEARARIGRPLAPSPLSALSFRKAPPSVPSPRGRGLGRGAQRLQLQQRKPRG